MSRENDLKIELGKRIRDLRKRHGLTQGELAKRIQVSQPAVVRYEAGERTPDIYVAMAITDEFGCTLEWLALGRGEDPTRKEQTGWASNPEESSPRHLKYDEIAKLKQSGKQKVGG